MHTIYCFNNGGSCEWYHAVAIADDGHVLAQHICSHECYMAHDLGIIGDWKHKNYNVHFGVGNWQLEWVADPKTHEGIKRAFELNKTITEPKDTAPKVVLKLSNGEVIERTLP